MFQRYKWTIIIVLGVILTPIVVNILIGFSWNDWLPYMVSSHGNSSEWLGFFGNFCGSVIGGLVTLLGLKITLDRDKKQNRETMQKIFRGYINEYKYSIDILRKITVEKLSTEEGFNDFHMHLKLQKEEFGQVSVFDNAILAVAPDLLYVNQRVKNVTKAGLRTVNEMLTEKESPAEIVECCEIAAKGIEETLILLEKRLLEYE